MDLIKKIASKYRSFAFWGVFLFVVALIWIIIGAIFVNRPDKNLFQNVLSISFIAVGALFLLISLGLNFFTASKIKSGDWGSDYNSKKSSWFLFSVLSFFCFVQCSFFTNVIRSRNKISANENTTENKQDLNSENNILEPVNKPEVVQNSSDIQNTIPENRDNEFQTESNGVNQTSQAGSIPSESVNNQQTPSVTNLQSPSYSSPAQQPSQQPMPGYGQPMPQQAQQQSYPQQTVYQQPMPGYGQPMPQRPMYPQQSMPGYGQPMPQHPMYPQQPMSGYGQPMPQRPSYPQQPMQQPMPGYGQPMPQRPSYPQQPNQQPPMNNPYNQNPYGNNGGNQQGGY